MDSIEHLSTTSKKILHSDMKPPPSPSPSGKPLCRNQELNQLCSKTPDKPIDPPRRTRNSGAALSKEAKETARKLRLRPEPVDKPDPVVDSTEEKIPFSPVTEPKKIPERYTVLEKLFNSLEISIRLCRMKGSMATFTNLSSKIVCLTDWRFTHSHLAQIKFILPEALDIKKILVLDERTSCMKPELLLALDVTAIEESKHVQSENRSLLLGIIFRSRLVDFCKSHPEDDEIPEAVLPEPFNASEKAVETKATFQESSTVTETLETAPSSEKPPILSHMSSTFRKSFSQKAIPRVTEEEAIVSGVYEEEAIETASPRKLSSNATEDVGSMQDEVSSACLRHSLLYATPLKNTIPDMISNPSAGTPVQFDSTPAKLKCTTPMTAPPKGCYTALDKDTTKSANKIVRRRLLNCDDTPQKNANFEDDDDLLDVLPKSLIRSAGLPKLFDIIYFLFQSIKRSVITKAELMHKIIMSDLDIVDTKEVEDQLRLLQEYAPEWIYEKLTASGDCLLCVNKISSPESIRSRLAEAM